MVNILRVLLLLVSFLGCKASFNVLYLVAYGGGVGLEEEDMGLIIVSFCRQGKQNIFTGDAKVTKW